MQWSKLKQRVERFFAPSVAGRVELRATRYRGAHDATGRGYITVDGREVWNLCSLAFEKEERERIDRRMSETAVSARQAQLDITPGLQSEGILAQWDFYRALEGYCNRSIEENLASTNPLVRSLSMLDARTGKRTLLTLSMAEEHPMVRYFHELRLNAEE
jgi:hypothetical protein